MKNKYLKIKMLLTFLSISSIQFSYSQIIKVESFKKTDIRFKYLLDENSFISKNDTINEMIVDLVEAKLSDSIIYKKKQHHKIGPTGWFISTFGGFNWRAFSMKKEKIVGTVVRISRSGEEQFTEYDINFDLNFHLKKYLFRMFEMYDGQAKIKRQDITSKHKKDYKSAPFIRDTNDIDLRQYRLHCELTPERAFRPALNYLFYPTLPGAGGLGKHPNFKNENPTVGFYGVLCLDCNHSCHPEMHPYEWMWWLKTNDDDFSSEKEWYVGLFHEASNRMKKWSKNPKAGHIKIPFAFYSDNKTEIRIQHGVMGEFLEHEDNISSDWLNEQGNNLNALIVSDDLNKKILINFVNPINTKGIKYRFENINFDKESDIISGYFVMDINVKDMYTSKISFITKE